MALQNVTLKAAADAFQVHPRTIVRALSGKHNTYWSEDINEDSYAISDIAKAYGLDPAALRRVFEKRDALLTPDEAAEVVGVKPRTFREPNRINRYTHARAEHGRIVRYLKSKMLEAAVAEADELTE